MSNNDKTFPDLGSLASYEDAVLLLIRFTLGAFLIWGVLDNIISTERMDEFVRFLTDHGFIWPEFMARLSVYGQFIVGLGFITGFAIRYAGLLCTINFIVAIVMVDHKLGIRGSFSSACLVLFGLYFMTHGGGKWSVDHLLGKKATPNA